MKRAVTVLTLLITVTVAAITILSVRAHAAAMPCGPVRVMLDHLAANFHEFIVMTGTAADQHMIVTMSNAGTYTVLLTDGKQACMILAGEKAELDNGT